MTTPCPEIVVLTADACAQRLRLGGVGRIALRGEGAPVLRPVNFTVHRDQILIRTGDGTIHDAAARGEAASFEIDAIDPLEHTGWSVVAVGKIRVYDEAREGPAPPLRAWASGTKDRFVVIRIDECSGIRIPSGRGNR